MRKDACEMLVKALFSAAKKKGSQITRFLKILCNHLYYKIFNDMYMYI
jgi:hypothetical protein